MLAKINMWQRSLDDQLIPKELRSTTTSLWEFMEGDKKLALVGVMRPNLLSEPYLWLHAYGKTYSVLRRVLAHMTALQTELGEQVVYAEVDPAIPANRKFLLHCGFTEVANDNERILMRREI